MNRDYEPAGQPVFEGEFYIDEWLIQPEINRIVINAAATQVQPRIMQVLVCLAEQPGKVVTRERLFEVVWAGTNVSEHVLSRSISELRKIFGDSARDPRVIETIPKTGYRLIAPVFRKPAESSKEADAQETFYEPAPEAHAPSSSSTRPWQGKRLAAALLALAAVLALLIYTVSLFSQQHHFHFHNH